MNHSNHSNIPCPACGDLDGCHLPGGLKISKHKEVARIIARAITASYTMSGELASEEALEEAILFALEKL